MIQNVFKSILIICMLFNCLSCTQDENKTEDSKITKQEIETVLTEMKRLGDTTGEMISIEIGNISNKDYKKYFQVTKNSAKVIEFSSAGRMEKAGRDYNYVVTCSWGNGTSKITKCGNDVGCAGAATWECLDNGGCATVCDVKSYIEYIPEKLYNTVLTKKVERALEEAREISNSNNTIIGFTLAVNDNNDQIRLNNIIEISKVKKLQKVSKSSSPNRQYRVICTGSHGETIFDLIYQTQRSASAAILDCTDNFGGCAEICDVVTFVAPILELESITKEDIEKVLTF